MRPSRWPGATVSMVTAALVTAATMLTVAPASAWARDQVVSTNPADGAALANAPTEVALTLSGTPDPTLSHVTARDGAGSVVNVGELMRIGDNQLRQPVSVQTTGDFAVAFHVTFTDAREAVGLVRFSVGTGIAPRGAPPGALWGAPWSSGAESGAADFADDVHHGHEVDPVGATMLAVDAAVLLVVAILLLRRPRPG